MASIDDVNSTLQGYVRTLGRLVGATQLSESFFLSAVVVTTTLTTTSVQVLAASPSRNGLLFHNPSLTTALIVAPALDLNGQIITASFSTTGLGFVVGTASFVAIGGTISQQAWNAVSQSGTTGPLIIGIS